MRLERPSLWNIVADEGSLSEELRLILSIFLSREVEWSRSLIWLTR